MNYINIISRRTLYVAMVSILAVAFVLPFIASALTLTERSIQLSSSSVGATSVYTVNFTAKQGAGAFVVDFCKNTPLIGQSCEAIGSGFTAAGATSTTTNFNDVVATTNRVVVTANTAIAVDDEVSVAISGIVNPTVEGVIYARIVSFDTKQHAIDSTPTALTEYAVDQGSVALSITPTIGVSGNVLEVLTFCVSGTAIADQCETTDTPVLALGEDPGNGVLALEQGKISSKSLFAQLTTNAVGGAVIRVKSTAAQCGGLLMVGAPTECYIGPALNEGLSESNNTARFGVRLATENATATPTFTGSGVLRPVPGSNYNHTTYALNFTEGPTPTTGVTSTFGDPFLDTNGAPASNLNREIYFGATISDSTPGGSYSTDLSLIATGTF